MTEREKMLGSLPYDSSDPELVKGRERAHELCQKYNLIPESHKRERQEILKELVPDADESAFLQGPIYFDYGSNIYIGKNFYANFNFTVLDCAPVTIGNDVFFGPNCSIVPPVHPLGFRERNLRFKEDGTPYTIESAKPVTIGDNCWIATGVTICGGVTIGEGCVIGAGSVVTRDIPPHSLAVGNPCRVLRRLTENDLR